MPEQALGWLPLGLGLGLGWSLKKDLLKFHVVLPYIMYELPLEIPIYVDDGNYSGIKTPLLQPDVKLSSTHVHRGTVRKHRVRLKGRAFLVIPSSV